MKYYGDGRQMEYDFIVSPGADFSQIEIQYEGAELIEVNEKGQLVVTTKWGEVIEQRPVIYQIKNNNRIAVEGKYLLQSDNSFSFELCEYDQSLELIIDPILSYSTFIGGYEDDTSFEMAVDNNGNAYIIGFTSSENFPTLNPYQSILDTTAANVDVFVTKINSAGNAIVFSTFLGGVLTEWGQCIDLDANNNIYISGKTASTDFPTKNPIQATYGGGTNDVFVCKLGSAGNTLEYSTYLGGASDEDASAIKVDNNGNVYLGGRTKSTDYPTQNAYQATYGGGIYDGFITKINNTGSTITYSSYIGTTGWDVIVDIEIDSNKNLYILGSTPSSAFPTKNAYQSTFGGGTYDYFITKFGVDGDSLVFSTYLGGNNYDYAVSMALDQSHNVYVIGNTKSTNFPTQNAYQASYGGGVYNVTVSKIGSTGSTLEYSTFLGKAGSGWVVSGSDISVSNNKAYVFGHTNSTIYPVANPYQFSKFSVYDCFISIFNVSGNALEFSSFFGGNAYDYAYAIVTNNGGDMYLTGYTNSTISQH